MDLKEKILNTLGDQKKNIKKYSITLLLIIAITFIMLFAGFEDEAVAKIYVIMLFSIILCFSVESILEINWLRIPLYIISIVLAYITKNIIFNDEHNMIILLAIAGAYLSITLYSIYRIIKDNEVSLSQFLGRFLNNNVILGIAISVLQMGLVFIASIITTLLLNESDYDIFLKFEILLFGLFIVPGELLCLINIKNKIIKPIKILICYIILPIVLIAGIIIYIYFIKLLITKEIPSNQIFAIISSLYVFACPTWIMINNFKDENKIIAKLSKIIPLTFIPFIIMQIYSLGVRIIDYGITPTRYIGLMLIVFEIITILLTIVKDHKYLNKSICVLIILIIIATIIPGINIFEMSWNSQLKRLTTVYKEGIAYNQLSEEEQSKAYGAYRYLSSIESDIKKNLPEYIQETDFGTKEYDYEMNERFLSHITYNGPENINIEGFKTIRDIDFYFYYYNETPNINEIDFSEIKIFDSQEKNNKIEENLKKFIYESAKSNKLTNDRIALDENTTFVFTFFNCSYYKNTFNIENLSFNGYMLMK